MIARKFATLNGLLVAPVRPVALAVSVYPVQILSMDKPVKVPPDVEAFFDKVDSDILSHDLATVMCHYSERYLDSGMRKGELERSWRQNIIGITSAHGVKTDFVADGDKAYFTGFIGSWFGKSMLLETSIIKENGEWRFYGNQRDVAP